MIFMYSGFLLILLSFVYGQKYFNCSSSGDRTNCEIEASGGVYRLPTNLDAGIKELEIGPSEFGTHYSYEVMNNSEFQKFKSLGKLIIRVKIWLFSFEVLESRDALTENLFFLENLTYLEIRGADFTTHQHSWKLPKNLGYLALSSSKYVSFDLSGCPRLQYVDLSYNQLTKLPSFSDPLPIRDGELTFDHNPLYEFTVDDIAGFCKARYIRFHYASMGSKRRKCECQRLKTWANETEAEKPKTYRYTQFFCNLDGSSLKLCKNYALKEAYAIRYNCLERTKEPGYSIVIFTLVVVVYLVTGFGCWICIFIVYRWRKWRLQTLNPNKDEDIEINEPGN